MREVIIGGIVFILVAVVFSVRPKDTIGVTATAVTVAVGDSATFVATLIHTGWFGRTGSAVPGMVTPNAARSIFALSPGSGVPGASPLTITVTGVLSGSGSITLNGAGAAGAVHDAATVTVTVTAAG